LLVLPEGEKRGRSIVREKKGGKTVGGVSAPVPTRRREDTLAKEERNRLSLCVAVSEGRKKGEALREGYVSWNVPPEKKKRFPSTGRERAQLSAIDQEQRRSPTSSRREGGGEDDYPEREKALSPPVTILRKEGG